MPCASLGSRDISGIRKGEKKGEGWWQLCSKEGEGERGMGGKGGEVERGSTCLSGSTGLKIDEGEGKGEKMKKKGRAYPFWKKNSSRKGGGELFLGFTSCGKKGRRKKRGGE